MDRCYGKILTICNKSYLYFIIVLKIKNYGYVLKEVRL